MSHSSANSQQARHGATDPRWRAVLARDERSDGSFVYAVRSTGVYCRPSCPSRRPRQNRVVFFARPEEAERAGFRPCRRCLPQNGALRDARAKLVQRICRFIEANQDDRITLAALGAEAGVSPHHLHRTFKRLLGITPRQYGDAYRVGLLKKRLREGQNVTTALYEAGYGSSSRLYERAHTHLGMTPATYRRGGRGMRIGYTIARCSLGRVLVGATEKGICALYLGDSDARLEAALHREYPQAEMRRDAVALGRWVTAIVGHLSGRRPNLDLPLDLQATAFQRRVWQELQRIPYGTTRAYAEIARALGRPKAFRAVARACATNPVSVIIPCHRVVRGDGSLGGYRWGLQRKRALLEKETKSAGAS